jgi:hypothetical protein
LAASVGPAAANLYQPSVIEVQQVGAPVGNNSSPWNTLRLPD